MRKTLTINQFQKINPLICIPSPRSIPVVKEAIDEIKEYDKLWFKDNFNELQVYQVFRNYFLEHKEYTHLVILPDDLFVDPEAFSKLVNDLEKKDYAVLSGICNFNCDDWEMFDVDLAIDFSNSSAKEYLLANDVPRLHHYSKVNKLKGIKKVAFVGFPITFIRRDVVEKIPFGSVGKGIDTHFSIDLLKNRIDQYVDFDARSIHLKGIENCIDISTLLGFQFKDNISTKVNFKKKVTPKLLLEQNSGVIEIDISKYINDITVNE